MPVERAFFEYLLNASGSPDMNVDGSVDPVEFVFQTPRAVQLHRMNMVSSGPARENLDGFFTLAELANGLTIVHRARIIAGVGGGVIQNFGTGIVPIRRHADFGALSGIDMLSDTEANESRHSVRWTLAKAGIPLAMQQFEEFVITVRDDLRAIDSMRAMVQGF